jgi:hypothetical protein
VYVEDAIVSLLFSGRDNNKCPAVNRTASVSGRVTFLIVSIRTVNGIRIGATDWRIWIRFPARVRIISLLHRV